MCITNSTMQYIILNYKEKVRFFFKVQFLRARESKSLQLFPDCLILVSSAWLHLLSVWHSSTKVATEISSAGKITTCDAPFTGFFSAVHLYSQHKYYSFRAGEEAIIIVRKYDIWTMLHIPSEAIYGRSRSLKSVLVLPPQIFGLFGPPKKRVNFDKFNQRQKCVFCVLTALYVSK